MPEDREFKYKALLSYSHADTDWAKRLHVGLEKFNIDRDLIGRETETGRIPQSLHPIFRDRDEFTAGYALTEQTIAALNASAALIVVCSPSAAQSHYVNEEVRRFKASCKNRPIIPFIVEGAPGNTKIECFPPALRFAVNADGTITGEATELVAADPRREGDGWQLALAKVVARLLGLTTDEVFQRAERSHRKRRTFQIAAGLVLVGLLLSGALLAWANYEKQASLAEIEALLAKYSTTGETRGELTKQNLTEALSAIVQGAATDPRYKQSLDLLKAGRAAEAEPLLQIVAEELAARAGRIGKEASAAYRHLGAIAGLRDPKRSLDAYTKAVELNPDDPDSLYWNGYLNLLAGDLGRGERLLSRLMVVSLKIGSMRDLYRAHLRLGEIDMARGNLSGSMDHHAKALSICEHAVATNPGNAEWQQDHSVSLEKIGDVFQAQGNLQASLENYKASFAIADVLAQAQPANAERQRDLSVSYNKVGDVLRAQGNLPASLDNYKASFTIRDRLAKADPGHAGWQRDLSVSYEKIGETLEAQHNLSAALSSFEASLAIRESLARIDPTNAGWQRDISVSQEKIGDVLQSRRDFAVALERFKIALGIRELLAIADPGNAGWQRDISVSHNKIGDLLLVHGDLHGALSSFENSLVIRQRLAKTDPENSGRQVDVSLCHVRLGQVSISLGDKIEALHQYRAARQILLPIVERSGHPLWASYLRDIDADIKALRE
jgi:tetratricopeptide (TPR) repeat protein